MTNPLEKQETAASVIVKTALMEAPFLILGVIAWLMTGQWFWIIVGIALGGFLWIPALKKLKQIEERDNASG